MHRLNLLIAATTAALLLHTTPAYAATYEAVGVPVGPSTAEVVEDIVDALAAQGPAAVVAAEDTPETVVDTELPADGSEPAEIVTDVGVLTLDMPARGRDLAPRTDAMAVFDGTAPDTAVAVQDGEGLRALVHIDSDKATERFDFPIGGDVRALQFTGDGGVDAVNAAGEVIATASAPWATDANGTPVPTHYEIDGTMLTQIVEHRAGDFTYGIVADPSFWWWAKQMAVCSVQVASVLVPGKIAQVTTNLAKAAKGSKAMKKSSAIIGDLGGVGNAVAKIGKWAKNKGGGLSSTDKARISALFGLGGAALADVLGLGGCWGIIKELT